MRDSKRFGGGENEARIKSNVQSIHVSRGGMQMVLDEATVEVDFAGLVIFSYPDLKAHFPLGITNGQNILQDFTSTDLGDAVTDAGAAIPISGIDDGEYRVRFLSESPEPSPERVVSFSDSGYVLKVESKLYVADGAVFWNWQEYLGWYEIDVEPGTYEVTIEGVAHLGPGGQIESEGYDLILKKVASLPRRTACFREDSRIVLPV